MYVRLCIICIVLINDKKGNIKRIIKWNENIRKEHKYTLILALYTQSLFANSNAHPGSVLDYFFVNISWLEMSVYNIW